MPVFFHDLLDRYDFGQSMRSADNYYDNPLIWNRSSRL
jgi:hypothetical protein